MTTLVQLSQLSKSYVNEHIETKALRDINLTIDGGEFVAITGPSGCGKSTLLALLGLMDVADSGEYQLANTAVAQLSQKQRAKVRNQHIGYVFQSFNLIDRLTVFDNVGLPLVYRGVNKAEIYSRVEHVLKQVGMEARAAYQPNQLSGGQQQRVAVARALVGEPDLLLLDEPTGNLDSDNGDQIMRLLLDLNAQGKTLVMVTHDPRYASMAKRQVQLLDGEIVTQAHSQASAQAQEVA